MRGTPSRIALIAVVAAGALACTLPKKSGPATDDDVSPERAKAFSKYELIASPKSAEADTGAAPASGETSKATTPDKFCGNRRAFEAKLEITATLSLNLNVARTSSVAAGISDADLRKMFELIGPQDGKILLSNQIELWCEEGSSGLKGKFEDKGKWYPIDPASTAQAEPDGRVTLDLVLRRPTTAEEIVEQDLRNPGAETLFSKGVSFVRFIEHRAVLAQSKSPVTGRAEATYEGPADFARKLPKGILSGESTVKILALSGTGGAPKTDPPQPSAKSKPQGTSISKARRSPGRSVPRRMATRTGTPPTAPTAWSGKRWILGPSDPVRFDPPQEVSWLDLDSRCSGKWFTRFPVDAAMKFKNAEVQERVDAKYSKIPERFKTHRFYFLYAALCFDFDGREEPFGAFCATENNPALCTGTSHEKEANWSPLLLARITARGGNKDEFLLAVEAASDRDQNIVAGKLFYDFGPDYADRKTARQRLRIAGMLRTSMKPATDGTLPTRFEGSLIVEPFQETADLLQKRVGIHDDRLLPKKAEPGWMVSP